MLKISDKKSFFLFGARGTGKSTYLKQLDFLKDKTLWIDLLEPESEEKYSLRPQVLYEELSALKNVNWIVIDEIQKIPKLLDVVHKLIEEKKLKFALTGSSSRKLKRVGANLLAGRAIRYLMYPITFTEITKKFKLNEHLNWGSLPEVLNSENRLEKVSFLKTYYEVYIKDEIVAEQAVRNLNPFRMFLPFCAQNETEPLNYTKIANAASVDVKTVQNYYEILIDTYMGFYLNSYSKSVRSAQREAPKFYFFDSGVKRAIEKQLTIDLEEQTTDYGKTFESWFVNECIRYNEYYQLDYSFSYLRTKDDAEIDLIIERPDKSVSLVEIKSAAKIEDRHLKHLRGFRTDFPKADYICVSREKKVRQIDNVIITPWHDAFKLLKLIK